MEYRTLGKTGLLVSEIGLGCFPIGGQLFIQDQPTGYNDVSEKEAVCIIKRAIDLGVNFFDTADVYGLGNSERRIGKAISNGHQRKKVIIATKAGWVPDGAETFVEDLSFHHFIAACNRSLKRLGTDYIDLFQCHSPVEDIHQIDEICRAFETLKKGGKIRYVGFSIKTNFKNGIKLITLDCTDALQVYYNIFVHKDAQDLLTLAKKGNIGIIAAIPLAQGLLTGKYENKKDFQRDDIRSINAEIFGKNLSKLKKLKFLHRPPRQTLAQTALKFVLLNPSVSVAISGARTVKQIEENIAVSGSRLSDEDFEKILSLDF